MTEKRLSCAELKANLGEHLDDSIIQPVIITRYNRNLAVIVGYKEYLQLDGNQASKLEKQDAIDFHLWHGYQENITCGDSYDKWILLEKPTISKSHN